MYCYVHKSDIKMHYLMLLHKLKEDVVVWGWIGVFAIFTYKHPHPHRHTNTHTLTLTPPEILLMRTNDLSYILVLKFHDAEMD